MSHTKSRLHRLLNTPPVLRAEHGGAPLSQATVCPTLTLSVTGTHTIRCTKRVGHEGEHFFGGFPEAVATPKPIAMVRHRFTVWIDVPAVSGDGWSQYPDYSAEETGRRLRRALADYGGLDIAEAVVEHADTTEVKK